jgi:hypothetical protein
MRPGPSLVAKSIFEYVSLDAVPTPLVELISRVVESKGWAASPAEAREKAESWHEPTLALLIAEVSTLHEMGRPSRIELNPSSSYLVQGACFIAPLDPDELKEKKLRRLRSSSYSQAFDKLTPDELELLCGKLIQLLGVKDALVSRRSADEGIDFYGLLPLETFLHPHDLTPTIQRQLRIWLIGQAKHHRRMQSGTSEIRDLVGAVTLGKAQAFGSQHTPLPNLAMRVGDPVFSVLVTTGSFSSNAWRLLERSGIVGVDGEMLAAFLADRSVAVVDNQFNAERFLDWVHK